MCNSASGDATFVGSQLTFVTYPSVRPANTHNHSTVYVRTCATTHIPIFLFVYISNHIHIYICIYIGVYVLRGEEEHLEAMKHECKALFQAIPVKNSAI